jgi:hypothetical protein
VGNAPATAVRLSSVPFSVASVSSSPINRCLPITASTVVYNLAGRRNPFKRSRKRA